MPDRPASHATAKRAALVFAGLLSASACTTGEANPDGGGDNNGTCEATVENGGVLRNAISDIDFTGGTITATSLHKYNVDAEENGCLARVTFSFERAGCSFDLVFDNPDRSFFSDDGSRTTFPWALI